MFYFDLDELDELLPGSRLFRVEGRAPISFRRKDYMGRAEVPLAQSVRDLVETQSGRRPTGPIRMLANPRYFGYVINPVCFYYCFDPSGEEVETIVAEINNTPWDERHPYVLGADEEVGKGSTKHYQFSKNFHVSPFMGMEQNYDWRFTEPGERLAVHMVSEENGKSIFDATLRVERAPLNAATIRATLLRYPLMTARIVSGIYWNALKLRIKGAQFYEHPAYAEGRSPYSKSTDSSENTL